MLLKTFAALAVLLYFSALVFAAANPTEICGLPAFWEEHKEYSDLIVDGAAAVIGLAGLGAGLLRHDLKFGIAGVLLLVFAAAHFVLGPPLRPELLGFGAAGSTHEHADFAVFINGEKQDFSSDKYMSPENGIPRSGLVHLHDNIGTVLHKHAAGVTLAYFFKTMGWSLNDSCISADGGMTYCNGAGNSLSIYVNGKPSSPVSSYSPADLDRVLVAYGNYSAAQVRSMGAEVTNYSCAYSLKCAAPAGIALPAEGCTS